MDDELDFPAMHPSKEDISPRKKYEIELDISSTLESLFGEEPRGIDVKKIKKKKITF